MLCENEYLLYIDRNDRYPWQTENSYYDGRNAGPPLCSMTKTQCNPFYWVAPCPPPCFQTVLFYYYPMYPTIANSKLLHRMPHHGIIFNNIIGNVHHTFFNIVLQEKTPQNTFLHYLKYSERLWPYIDLSLLILCPVYALPISTIFLSFILSSLVYLIIIKPPLYPKSHHPAFYNVSSGLNDSICTLSLTAQSALYSP